MRLCRCRIDSEMDTLAIDMDAGRKPTTPSLTNTDRKPRLVSSLERGVRVSRRYHDVVWRIGASIALSTHDIAMASAAIFPSPRLLPDRPPLPEREAPLDAASAGISLLIAEGSDRRLITPETPRHHLTADGSKGLMLLPRTTPSSAAIAIPERFALPRFLGAFDKLTAIGGIEAPCPRQDLPDPFSGNASALAYRGERLASLITPRKIVGARGPFGISICSISLGEHDAEPPSVRPNLVIAPAGSLRGFVTRQALACEFAQSCFDERGIVGADTHQAALPSEAAGPNTSGRSS